MAVKIQKWLKRWTNPQNSCYNSRIIEHISRFNACLKIISIVLKIKLKNNSYFDPIWLPKFKMAGKVKKISEKLLYWLDNEAEFVQSHHENINPSKKFIGKC